MNPSLAAMRTRHVHVPAANLRRGRGAAVVHTAHWPAQGGAPADAPVQVLLHGLGGSHLNWGLLGGLLATAGPVWAPDLAGFGLTMPTNRSSSVEDNIDLAIGFVRAVSPDRPALLVGNSMGGHIAYSLAALRPDLVAGLVLVGPAVPPQTRIPDRAVATRFALFATPLLGRAYLARRRRVLTPDEESRETLELVMADVDRLDPDLFAAHVGMAATRRRMDGAPEAFLTAARTLLRRLGPGRRRLWQAIDRIDAPALVLQGEHDRLVERPACDRLAARRRDWSYTVYDDLGHVVMIEDPERVAEDIRTWRAEHLAAGRDAR